VHAIESPTDTEFRYASGFARMFWAFLFLGLSFRLTLTLGRETFMIDLLPDFLGYLLIAAGAHRLLDLHPRARGIRNLAMLLTFLALPDAVQYKIELSQAGNLTYWITPTFPLSLVVGILDAVLVWKLCGLIANVARQAMVARTEQAALNRRVFYVVLKVITLGIVGLVFAAPLLIIPAAIVGVILGIIVMCLMMGLMRQAERLCAAGLVAGETATLQERSALGFRLLVLLALVLPVILIGGFIWYYYQWNAMRNALDRDEAGRPYDEIIDAFWQDVEQDRLDAAFARTTLNLRKRMTREQFEELVRQNPAIRTCREKNRGSGAGSGGGPLGGYANRSYTVQNPDGTLTTFSVTVRRGDDSLFQRQPPSPGVDDLTIQQGGQQGFMHPFAPGRLH
jgi:hypothetical protein